MSVETATLPSSLEQLSLIDTGITRKRTSSFSYPTSTTAGGTCALSPSPRPAKSARIMGAPLKRQETVVWAPRARTPTTTTTNTNTNATANTNASTSSNATPTPRTKRRAPTRSGEPITISTGFDAFKSPSQSQPPSFRPLLLSSSKPASGLKSRRPASSSTATTTSTPGSSPSSSSTPRPLKTTVTRARAPLRAPTQIILPSLSSPTLIQLTSRSTSPLNPTPAPRPARPVFPRSHVEPDLYKTAIKTRMSKTAEGQKVLMMGARIAWDIERATRELERIVGECSGRDGRDGDVVMGDATSVSGMQGGMEWQGGMEMLGMERQVRGRAAMPVLTASWVMVKGDDWEMVDCAA